MQEILKQWLSMLEAKIVGQASLMTGQLRHALNTQGNLKDLVYLALGL